MSSPQVANSPKLGQAVVSLAAAVETSMAGIYNLQTALGNVSGPSDSVLSDVKMSRAQLRSEFNGYVELLENSYRFAKEYSYLCNQANAHEQQKCVAFARSFSPLAELIRKQVSESNDRHRKILQLYDIYKARILNSLSGEGISNASSVPSSVAEYSNDCGFVVVSRLDFMHLAQKAAHPHGPEALSELYKGLAQIGVCLQDILVFWDDQYRRLSQYTLEDASKMSELEFVDANKVWDGDTRSLRRCIDSIIHSCDAMKVDPPSTSSRHHFPNPFSPGPGFREAVRKQKRHKGSTFPEICELRLPTSEGTDSSHPSISQPVEGVLPDNRAHVFKFLAPPNAPNVRALRDSALTVFMLLEPWAQAQKSFVPHAALPEWAQKIAALHSFSDHRVVDLIDRVVRQAGAYRSAIADSVKTAEDGHAFAKDALGLYASLVEGKRSARAMITFVDSMQVIAKRSQETAAQTQQKFRDTRVALMEITSGIPAIATAIGKQATSKKIVIPIGSSERKTFAEVQLELERAQRLLERVVTHVSHSVSSVSSVNWWRSVQTDLKALKEAIPTIAVDGSNPIRTEMSRDQWLDVKKQYKTYSDEMLLLHDYFRHYVSSS